MVDPLAMTRLVSDLIGELSNYQMFRQPRNQRVAHLLIDDGKHPDGLTLVRLRVVASLRINCWMSVNHLKLITDITQFLLLGTRQQLIKLKRKSVSIDGVDMPFSDEVTCLGVVFDNELKFSIHINQLAGKLFYHLRQMRSVLRPLLVDATRTLVNAFTTSRIDYCIRVFSRVAVIFVRYNQY